MPRLVTKFKYLKYLKPNRKVSAGGYATVSYTHLDVYKRQGKYGAEKNYTECHTQKQTEIKR